MTLSEAQATFRRAPSRATALAYMDAAIEAWENAPHSFFPNGSDRDFKFRLQEIRDWLMNENQPEPDDDYADRAEWKAHR